MLSIQVNKGLEHLILNENMTSLDQVFCHNDNAPEPESRNKTNVFRFALTDIHFMFLSFELNIFVLEQITVRSEKFMCGRVSISFLKMIALLGNIGLKVIPNVSEHIYLSVSLSYL